MPDVIRLGDPTSHGGKLRQGPAKGVKQLFRTKGYDHPGSYKNEAMLALTLQLIARIALDAK